MNDSKTHKRRDAISAKKIDELVTAQAQDEASWEAPVEVKRTNKAGAFSIPADLAERAAFLARVHHAKGIEEWITTVIKERTELEESAFAAAKRELHSSGVRRTNASSGPG